MTKIIREKIVPEEVEIPEEHVVCPHCKGKGLMSKYDEGWSSVVHSPELAAKHECYRCNGLGYVPEEKINGIYIPIIWIL